MVGLRRRRGGGEDAERAAHKQSNDHEHHECGYSQANLATRSSTQDHWQVAPKPHAESLLIFRRLLNGEHNHTRLTSIRHHPTPTRTVRCMRRDRAREYGREKVSTPTSAHILWITSHNC